MTSYLVTNLISDRSYKFYVVSVDVNGIGLPSLISSFISCVAPANMTSPKLQAVNQTSYTISWNLPQSDGGCPITGYAIYSDYGSGGLINIDVDAALIANQPYLFEHTVTLNSTYTGLTIRVKVEA